MGVMIEGRDLFDLGEQALIDLLHISAWKRAGLRRTQAS
jgi:hypothetical protein